MREKKKKKDEKSEFSAEDFGESDTPAPKLNIVV